MKPSEFDPKLSVPERGEALDSVEKIKAFFAWVKAAEPFVDPTRERLYRSMLNSFDEGRIDDSKIDAILNDQENWWSAYWIADHGINEPSTLIGFDCLSFKIFANRYGLTITPEMIPAWWAGLPADYWTK